jgi:aspartyl-tRNA(Asn)/glutamyl-tRNA(Gln) amidotransferase subunit B
MPEPDLPPLVLAESFLAETRAAMPELPRDTALRLVRTYPGVGHHGAWALMFEPGGVEYFETAASELPPALHERLFHWVTSELYGALHSNGVVVADSPVEPHRLAELVRLVAEDHVSGVAAKRVLSAMLAGDSSPPSAVAEGLGVVQVSGDAELEALCRSVLAANPVEFAAYRETRNPKYLKFFVGQAMRASKGSANPKKVQPLLTTLLDDTP